MNTAICFSNVPTPITEFPNEVTKDLLRASIDVGEADLFLTPILPLQIWFRLTLKSLSCACHYSPNQLASS